MSWVQCRCEGRPHKTNKDTLTRSYELSMCCLCVCVCLLARLLLFLWRLKKELFLFFSRRLEANSRPIGFGWDDGPTTFHPFATLGLEKWNKRKASTKKKPLPHARWWLDFFLYFVLLFVDMQQPSQPSRNFTLQSCTVKRKHTQKYRKCGVTKNKCTDREGWLRFATNKKQRRKRDGDDGGQYRSANMHTHTNLSRSNFNWEWSLKKIILQGVFVSCHVFVGLPHSTLNRIDISFCG